MRLFSFSYRFFRMLSYKMAPLKDIFITKIKFQGNDVIYHDFRTKGIPYVMVARGAKGLCIGHGFSMNNTIKSNPIGIASPCIFFVDRGASITIGNDVGMSQVALVSYSDITIGDNVKIGGGTCVYTSDFHSLNAAIRASKEDFSHRKTAPVCIGHDAFIGAHCIILKGVTIGEKSIVGAGSVVTKNIPAGQIWAGNPAKYIRDVEE